MLTERRNNLLLLMPDLPQVGVVNSFAINELYDAATVTDVGFIGLTPATEEEIEQWKDISMATYPIYNMDDSELKMIARGNPAVVYLQDGVITWKRTLSSLDSVDQSKEMAAWGMDSDKIMTELQLAYLLAMLALLVINRTHVLIKNLFFKKKPDTDTEM